MRRRLLLLLSFVLAGCSSAAPKLEEQRSADRSEAPAKVVEPKPGDQPTEKTPAPEKPIAGDAYNKVPESKGGTPPGQEPERVVTLPGTGSVSRDARPALPEKSIVAVAFVRGGKLVRRKEALLKLAHELARENDVKAAVALERLDAGAPDPVSVAELAKAASKQGADLLVLDVRDQDGAESWTTLVVHASSSAVLACAKTETKNPEPAGSDLVARLVVSTGAIAR